MNTKNQHARSCVIHPSKLTFQSCPNCGCPMCQDCLRINHLCENCKKALESKTFQKSTLFKAGSFLIVCVSITFLFLVVNRPTPVTVTDHSPTQPAINSPSDITAHPVAIHPGENDITPSIQPDADLITEDTPKPTDKQISELRNTQATKQKEKFKKVLFLPGTISGVDRTQNGTLKIIHQVQTVSYFPYFQTGPWRIPSLHPYADQPDFLNPPFSVVPQNPIDPILTTKSPVEILTGDPMLIHQDKNRTKVLVQSQRIAKTGLAEKEVISNRPEKTVVLVKTESNSQSNDISTSDRYAKSCNQPGPWRVPAFYPPTYQIKLLDPPFSVVPSFTAVDRLIAAKEPDVTPKIKVALKQLKNQKKKGQVQPKQNALAVAETKKPESNSTKKTKVRTNTRSKVKRYKTGSLAGHLFGQNKFSKYHLEKVPTSKKIITLSFDGDHLNNCTETIMRLLNEKGVKANIFLTGKFIQLFPETVIAIQQAGHEIGNHTWNHPHLTQYEKNRTHKTRDKITKAYFMSQLSKTSDIYFKVTGVHFQPFWRAPFGEHNLDIRSWAYSAGYLHIGWTRGYDSMDWMVDPRGKYYLSPKKLKRKLLEDLKNPGHKIVLMHLGSKRPEPERPYTILADFIDKARAKGYHFATVSQVMKESHGFQMASRAP